jgi:hypothetical protein
MKLTFLLSIPLLASTWCSSDAPTAPTLIVPVKCEIGQSCLIQKLVDHDRSPGRQDYRCGLLTTDGHDGVDIRLRTMDDMRKGYPVIAAAAGKVLRVRDGEADISVRSREGSDGKEAGNGVVIDHGDGWESQYSHLRQGSVAVRIGQQVAAGEQLGLVGMSGNAEFPHLHFTVRYDGEAIDPFIGAKINTACNSGASVGGLWSSAASKKLSYVPTTIITAGLASNVPPKSVADRTTPSSLTGAGAPLILWVDMIGAKAGDMQEFAIIGPNGKATHNQESPVKDGGLSWFAYSGKRAPADGWLKGQYIGRYTLRRNGSVVARTETTGIIR